MAYTPPAHNAVNVDFIPTFGGYTPPAHNAINVAFGVPPNTLASAGVNVQVFGAIGVRNYNTLVHDAGLVSLVFGTAKVLHEIEFFPVGIASLHVGSHNVFLKTRHISPTGKDFHVFGRMDGGLDGQVGFALRKLFPTGINKTVLGAATATYSNRTIDMAGNAVHVTAFGTARITYRIRTIHAIALTPAQYGHPRVDRTHFVGPSGWDSQIVNTLAQVGKPRQNAFPPGLRSLAIGALNVVNHTLYIHPSPVLGSLPGDSNPSKPFKVYNKKQLVKELDVRDFYDNGWVSYLVTIVNKNRYQTPSGWNSNANKWGLPFVRNNAFVYHQQGFVATKWGNNHIGYRVRTFNMTGFDNLYAQGYGTVVYKTPSVNPLGIRQDRLGLPTVVNTRRTFLFNGIDQALYGRPFVAFRVRSLFPTMPDLSGYNIPRVSRDPQTVNPVGFTNLGFGNVVSQVILITIWPNPVAAQLKFGNQLVYNKTPELHPYGIGSLTSLFGTAKVRTQWRFLPAQGFAATLFGTDLVEYRTRHATAIGIKSLKIVNTHRISKVSPDPPGPQTLAMNGFITSSFFTTRVYIAEIQPAGFINSLFGNATVILQGCHVVGIPPPYDLVSGSQFGTPHLNPSQYVNPAWPDSSGLDSGSSVFGAPHFDPHYIWAPQGYPYTDYHPNEGEHGHAIDTHTDGFAGQVTAWGTTFVSLKNRKIFPFQFGDFASYGIPRISTNPQYAHPNGFAAFKYGIPSFNGGGEVDAAGYDMSSYGIPVLTVPRPNPWLIKPAGINQTGFGTLYIDFFNRTRHPAGLNTFTMSPPGPFPPSSYLHKNYTVVTHAYLPFVMSAGLQTGFGTAFIAFRIRSLFPEGDDMSVVCDDAPGDFNEGFKIIRNSKLNTIGGLFTQAFGLPQIGQKNRTLRPAGIWQTKLGDHAVRYSQTAQIDGFDSSEWGDVWRVIAGEVQVRGAPFTSFGVAQINQRIHGQGWLDNAQVVETLHIGGDPTFDYYDSMGQEGTLGGLIPTMSVSSLVKPNGLVQALFGGASVVRSGGICAGGET